MHGYKTVEVRSSEPRAVRGRCAVHFSRTYARAAYDEDKAYIVSNWKSGRIVERELPSYETLAKHAGEIVGVVEYEADAEDPYRWVLSNPVWLKRFIPIVGHPAMWYLPREVAANINRQLSEIENKKGA
ncbi:MAG: hypothetical protein IJ640_01135 [Prevotella sp.]|nr:hypothetical protein [Prevotella sp.]